VREAQLEMTNQRRHDKGVPFMGSKELKTYCFENKL